MLGHVAEGDSLACLPALFEPSVIDMALIDFFDWVNTTVPMSALCASMSSPQRSPEL